MNSAFFDSIRLLASKKQFKLPITMAQIAGKDRRFHKAAEEITRSKNCAQIIATVNRLDQARVDKQNARKLFGNPRQRRAPDGFLAAMKVAVKHRGRKVALSYAQAIKDQSQFSSPLEKQATKLVGFLGKHNSNAEVIQGITRLARRKQIKRTKKWRTVINLKPAATIMKQKLEPLPTPHKPDSNAPYIVWMTPRTPKV